MNAHALSMPVLPHVPRWPRRLLRAIIAIVSLVVLFYVEENWRGARAFERIKSSLEARGESLTFEKLFPEIPDDQNFFAAPVIREKFGSAAPGFFQFKDGGTLGDALGAA